MPHAADHRREGFFPGFHAREPEGLRFISRRGALKTGLAGLAGLTLPRLLQARETASAAGKPLRGRKALILIWMTGGPSQIDTFDVKPLAPREIRGPFAATDDCG